jgi:hypothetical protein
MKQKITKFLEFKGKNLLFLSKDGIRWVAIKPICEAINVEYTRSFKNLKEDPILGPALSIQPMQVSENDQVRQYSCLPEYLIYGWLFSIKSESKELLEYKKECYQVLFNFFHGTITGHKELLGKKATAKHELALVEKRFKEIEGFNRIGELHAEIARIGIALKRIDDEEVKNQLDLFDEN